MLYIQEQIQELGLNYDLEYVVPDEGTTLWIDSWVIPKMQKTKKLQNNGSISCAVRILQRKTLTTLRILLRIQALMSFLIRELQDNKALFPDMDSPGNEKKQ